MTRACIRGCMKPGEHFAACPSYGAESGECAGCVPVEARHGTLVCDRCYGRLRRRLEAAPDLVAHLRSIADPLKAQVYDRVMVSGSGPAGSPAPVAADLIDASADIMHVLGAGRLAPGASSFAAYRQALGAVGTILAAYDELANDADAFTVWWRLVMSAELEDHPGFWTITRALSRWPMEDRRKWAAQPCPECGLRAVKITPPRHRRARTWLTCSSCTWAKNDADDDGLWVAMFGLHASDYEEGDTMTQEQTKVQQRAVLEGRDIDLADAIRAGVAFVVENAEAASRIGKFGVPSAAVIGATPQIAEQFAQVAEDIAKQVRRTFANGDLLAGGAKLVAEAIRASVTDDPDALAAVVAELAQHTEDVEAAA